VIFKRVRASRMHVALLLIKPVDGQQALVIISFQQKGSGKTNSTIIQAFLEANTPSSEV
jgi:hypothetical protein